MKHLSLLLMISLIALSCTGKNGQSDEANIKFLSQIEGAGAILDETYEPYFSQLQIREISAFTQMEVPTTDLAEARAFAKEKFSSAVSDFSADEKECISFVTNSVVQTLKKNEIGLMANHPWKFIKIENWLCGGFAHTRGNYIILSQKHIDHLSKEWSNNMTAEEETTLIKKLGSLLVHEQMHSLQRSYKTKFNQLYLNDWDYTQAQVEPAPQIDLDQVSNPDAPIAEWLIPAEEDYYWIRTLLKETDSIPQMGKDFVNKVFLVSKSEDKYTLKKDHDGKVIEFTMEDLEGFSKSFPEIAMRGIDHPNEISAYLFSEYFEGLVAETLPFENVASEASAKAESFNKWVDQYM